MAGEGREREQNGTQRQRIKKELSNVEVSGCIYSGGQALSLPF